MRLLAIVPSIYDTNPGQRYRIEQWEPHLRQRGVEINYHSFEDEELNRVIYKAGNLRRKMQLAAGALRRRAALMRRLNSYDAIYVFREAALFGPPIFERLIHRSRVPFVFDFDDAIFVPYRSPSNGYLSYLKFPAKTRTICRLASHVMAGNPYLADYARQVNSNVTIVPTTIDTEKYVVDETKNVSDPPIIGWSGSHSTVQHLDTLRSVLQRLAKEERFRLRVIGTPHYELEGVDLEVIMWRSETETLDLQPVDIGIMPLPDDRWSKGKCGAKALQYMGLAIPTVCSPVGVNTDIIQDGVNGLIAATEDEWLEKLKRLLRDAELRKRLGRAGRATVEQQYSALAQAPRVYQILESVVSQAGARGESVGENASIASPPQSRPEKDWIDKRVGE